MEGVIHIISGLIPAIILVAFQSPRWTAVVCLIGSVLPDLIDKPLALCVGSYWSGRYLAHTLVFAIIVFMVALWYWYFRSSRVLLPLAPMIALHHGMDAMWQYPKIWYFPVYGPIPITGSSSQFYAQIIAELHNPLIFVILLIVVVWWWINQKAAGHQIFSLGCAVDLLAFRDRLSEFVKPYEKGILHSRTYMGERSETDRMHVFAGPILTHTADPKMIHPLR